MSAAFVGIHFLKTHKHITHFREVGHVLKYTAVIISLVMTTLTPWFLLIKMETNNGGEHADAGNGGGHADAGNEGRHADTGNGGGQANSSSEEDDEHPKDTDKLI